MTPENHKSFRCDHIFSEGRHPRELRRNARLGTQGTQVEGDKKFTKENQFPVRPKPGNPPLSKRFLMVKLKASALMMDVPMIVSVFSLNRPFSQNSDSIISLIESQPSQKSHKWFTTAIAEITEMVHHNRHRFAQFGRNQPSDEFQLSVLLPPRCSCQCMRTLSLLNTPSLLNFKPRSQCKVCVSFSCLLWRCRVTAAQYSACAQLPGGA